MMRLRIRLCFAWRIVMMISLIMDIYDWHICTMSCRDFCMALHGV